MGNTNIQITNAKSTKNDEFYTQLDDISKEVFNYKDYFKNKVVYCNCDDPIESYFFYYFTMKFESFGLKKLISTCYKNTDYKKFSNHTGYKGACVEYTGVKEGNNQPTDDDYSVQHLNNDGDFRSDECIEILKQTDIVVTNPPFSLFREYINQLIEYDKKFIIIGNMGAMCYKNIFPLIMDNKIWLGYKKIGEGMYFKVPEWYNSPTCKFNEEGEKIAKTNSIWWTNLDHEKRHEFLDPIESYNPENYPKLDNYNAINVNKVRDIPHDYNDIMAVPVTFLDKWNPDEFEILGITESWWDNTGIIKSKSEHPHPFLNGKKLFARLLIKKKTLTF